MQGKTIYSLSAVSNGHRMGGSGYTYRLYSTSTNSVVGSVEVDDFEIANSEVIAKKREQLLSIIASHISNGETIFVDQQSQEFLGQQITF